MISIYKDFDNPPKDLLGDNPKITKAVKQALYDLYHGKCAYTEEKLDFEEMEVAQYRPVSLYPALEFEWSNLLPVSKQINILLSNNFPIDGEQVDEELLLNIENRKADSACLLAEKPLLLHPEVDTTENHLTGDEELMGLTKKGTVTLTYLELDHKLLINKSDSNITSKIDAIIEELEQKLDSIYDTKDFPNKSRFKYPLSKKYQAALNPFLKELQFFTQKDKEYSYNALLYIKSILTRTGILGNSSVEQKLNKLKIINIAYHSFVSTSHPNRKDWAKPLFPAIARLDIRHFHFIKKFTLPNIPINSKWVFLTGENATGKSLLLQAIALGFLNEKDNILELNENTRIQLEINYKNTPLKLLLDNEFKYSDRTLFHNWCAYGTNRISISGNINATTQTPQKVNKTDSLFRDIGVLSNVEAYLINIEGKEQFKEKGNSIKRLLIELLPSIEEITIDNSKEKSVVLYREKAEDDSLMPPITFNALSAGNKSIIAMIGDMVLDLSDSQNVNDLSDLEGIVLIDEIDIHLHPNWQKKFVQTLTRLFPKIQFIASTHSPIPLLGAPKETVILNVEKPSSREGIKVRKLDIDVTTLTPNTILTSPIFGFEGLSSVESEDQPRIYTQESYDDVAFEKALKANLQKLADDDDLSKYIIEKK